MLCVGGYGVLSCVNVDPVRHTLPPAVDAASTFFPSDSLIRTAGSGATPTHCWQLAEPESQVTTLMELEFDSH